MTDIQNGPGRSPTAPDHLFTWVDVDRYFADLARRGRWPEWLLEVAAYWDRVEITARSEVRREVIWSFLSDVVGPLTIDSEKGLLFLDTATVGEPDRFLYVEVREESEIPERDQGPQWGARRVTKDWAEPIGPPSGSSLPHGVPVCAFHSYKGGVGRTLHCVAAAHAVASRGRRVLLVDADLEAPGITWMVHSQALRIDFSFEDFLALAHGSQDADFADAISLGAKFLANQELDGVIVMPSRREHSWLEPARIEPRDLLTPDRNPYLLTETLARLAHRLDADVVMVDLRAGVSELNAPLLLDPRVNRILVSTISDQSVRGGQRVLDEIVRRAPARDDTEDPSISVLLTQFNLPDHEKRLESIVDGLRDALLGGLGKNEPGRYEADADPPIMLSRFDPQLLNLPAAWGEVRDLIAVARVADPLGPLVDTLAPLAPTAPQISGTPETVDLTRRLLHESARRLVFAETSDEEGFLVTEALDNLVEAHRTELPIEVVIGAKGSGKTFTFLQVCRRKRWSEFARAVSDRGGQAHAHAVPVIDPENISKRWSAALRERRAAAAHRFGHGPPAERLEIVDLIRAAQAVNADEVLWRRTWLACFARAIGLPATPEDSQTVLADFARRGEALFVLDGLEDIFQNFNTDPAEQKALRVLLTDCLEWLRTLRQRPLGILVFIRQDLAQVAISQNFAQFQARHGNYSLRWNRDEALRLAAWVCQRGGVLDGHELSIKDASPSDLSRLMANVWGEKMGSPKSKEARSEQWFFAALSDFSGQLQARDIVTFVSEAAELSVGDRKWLGRILTPTAMRSALPECSRRKIEAIAQENKPVGALLARLRDQVADKKKVPFALESLNLTLPDARLLEANGVVFREGDLYWIPEIFRHGLGFRATGRPRVLAIANLVRRRNDSGAVS